MGCFVALFALISPRLALFFVWIFSNWLSRAFDGPLLPILGFFLLPWTTLGWTVMWVYGSHGVHGFEWFIVAIAFLADLGAFSESRKLRRREA